MQYDDVRNNNNNNKTISVTANVWDVNGTNMLQKHL